jgi:hypothetical protein
MNDASRGRNELLLFPRHCLVCVRGEAWKTYDEVWSLAGNRLGYLKNENELSLSPSSCTSIFRTWDGLSSVFVVAKC